MSAAGEQCRYAAGAGSGAAVGGAATLLSACLLYSRRRAAQKRPKGHAAGYQMTDIAAMSSTAT